MKEQKQIVIQLNSDKKSYSSTEKKKQFEIIELEQIKSFDDNNEEAVIEIEVSNETKETVICEDSNIIDFTTNHIKNNINFYDLERIETKEDINFKKKIFTTQKVERTPVNNINLNIFKVNTLPTYNINITSSPIVSNMLEKKRHYSKLKSLDRKNLTQLTLHNIFNK